MLNIPDLATKWGHIFAGENQVDTFRGTTLVARADLIAADYTTAAEQRLAADGLYSQVQSVDSGLNSTIDFFFNMAKQTLIVASQLDVNYPIATDDDTMIAKLVNDMVAQAQTFQLPTIQIGGAASSAATPVTTLQGAPFGTGTIVGTIIEPRTAVVRYYTYAETIRLTCTADSYVDGATAGQETFTVQSYSSVDNDTSGWPKGSNVNTTFQSAGSNVGTLINNAYFDNWDSTTPNTLLSWTVKNLTPSVDIFQDATDNYVGLYAVKLLAAGLNAEITQLVNGLTGIKNYLLALRIKRITAVTGGVITVALRDANGVILQDAGGNNMSFTYALTGAPGAYVLTWHVCSVPRGFPTQVFCSIKVTTAMNPAEAVGLATAEFVPMQNLYLGGPDIGFLPGNIGWADHDMYTFATTTTASKATFVKNMDRLYNTRAKGVDLPVALAPTISDALIV